MIYSIIYTSKAKQNLTLNQIHTMLVDAKSLNKKRNITGCILYHNQKFIQLIEGDKNKIETLYATIKADARHFDIETIISKASTESIWNDWSMAFYNFAEQEDDADYKRLLLESSFENANKKVKNSEILSLLRQHTSALLDN